MKTLTTIVAAAFALHCSAEEVEDAFGSSQFETGFTGEIYDMKIDADGEPSDMAQSTGNSITRFYDAFGDLVRKRFERDAVLEYHEGLKQNDLRYLLVPSIEAELVPDVFGSDYIIPKQIFMVYRGVLEKAPKKKLRFAGVFDDAMCVLVNGKLVFYVSRHEDELRYKPKEVSNRRKKSDNGLGAVAYGEYIELKKGDEITLVLAEVPGGQISGKLLVQLEKYRYREDSYEDPILHPFVCGEYDNDDLEIFKRMGVETGDIPEFEFKIEDEEEE